MVWHLKVDDMPQLEAFFCALWKTASLSAQAKSTQGEKRVSKQRSADWILHDPQNEEQQQVPTAAVTTVKNSIPPAFPTQSAEDQGPRGTPGYPLLLLGSLTGPDIQGPFRGWPFLMPDLCPCCQFSDICTAPGDPPQTAFPSCSCFLLRLCY